MVGCHHQLDGHKFKQAPGVSNGQGSLECYSLWSHKDSDMTERLNWTVVFTANLLTICISLTFLTSNMKVTIKQCQPESVSTVVSLSIII